VTRDVSVIIPAQNAAGCIGGCVAALRSQRYDGGAIQILVVDDGSCDGTAAAARSAGAEVIALERPRGAAAARNAGAASARAELLLFTDADCEPAPDWVERMVAPFRDAGVIGAKGVYRTRQRSLTARFVQSEYESRYSRMRRWGSLDFVDTYAAAYLKTLFERAGGFDEAFPGANVEDQEFSFRYSRLSGRIALAEDAVVYHRHADSPWKYWRKKMRIGFWKARVLRRHPDKWIRDAHTPQSLKVEMLAALAVLASAPFAIWPLGAGICLGALAAFSASILPGAIVMARRDARLGAAAPAFLFLRASGLGLGLLAGLPFAIAAAPLRRSTARPAHAAGGSTEDGTAPPEGAGAAPAAAPPRGQHELVEG
jgi:GT2 family glycosyltransferase